MRALCACGAVAVAFALAVAMSFLHASAPRAVSDSSRTGVKIIESSGSRATAAAAGLARSRYRDPVLEAAAAETIYVKPNIMFDPRVARGINAGKTIKLADTSSARTTSNADSFAVTRAMPASESRPYDAESGVARPSKQALIDAGLIRPSHPTAAYIHNHITVVKKRVEVPMHLYLVEQKEATLVHDIDAQTDEMMPEPPAPAYIPRKTGVDTATQVDTDMVFQFDTDVSAILEVVTSKTLEQALMEVREEEELAAIAQHATELRDKLQAEEAAADEELRKERALHAVKEQMLADARRRQRHVLAIRAKLAASHFSRAYLADLSRHAINDLRTAGFFNQHDSVAHQLESTYLPGIATAVDLELTKTAASRSLVSEMLAEGLEARSTEKAAVLAERARVAAARAAEEAAAREAAEELARRQRTIQLFIHTTAVPPEASPVGPITLTGESTVADIESKVYRWMEDHLPDAGAEVPPREYLKFLWNGGELDKASSTAVYDLGLTALATLTMELDLPPPPPEPEKEEGEDDEEDDEDEDDKDEEEEDEDEDDV